MLSTLAGGGGAFRQVAAPRDARARDARSGAILIRPKLTVSLRRDTGGSARSTSIRTGRPDDFTPARGEELKTSASIVLEEPHRPVAEHELRPSCGSEVVGGGRRLLGDDPRSLRAASARCSQDHRVGRRHFQSLRAWCRTRPRGRRRPTSRRRWSRPLPGHHGQTRPSVISRNPTRLFRKHAVVIGRPVRDLNRPAEATYWRATGR